MHAQCSLLARPTSSQYFSDIWFPPARTYAYPSRQEGQLTVFLGPLAGWKPAAETRSVARVRDSESMQRAVWRKNPGTFYVADGKKCCPLGKKRYRIDWKFTLSVPKGQSALISKD